MNKPHAHIYSAGINKWIAGTLKLPTYLWPRLPHGASRSQMTCRSVHRFLHGSWSWQTYGQTDHATPFGTIGHIYVWSMRCGPITLWQLEMWASAQRDGRPAEYRWRPLFNAAVWLTPTTWCRAVTMLRRETRENLQGCLKLPDRSQPLVGWNPHIMGACGGHTAA